MGPLTTGTRRQAPQLLVSVATPEEAADALAGGADIIDAKNPREGTLGPVSLADVRSIASLVGGTRPVSAALGDVTKEALIEESAHAYSAVGVRFVKIGFAGLTSSARVEALTRAAVRGAQRAAGSVVAVAYADATQAGSIAARDLLEVAARAGAAGVLLDTANKRGPSLPRLVTPSALRAWVARAHDHGLLVGLAGKLVADDLPFVRQTGADVVGVRGAACVAGRTGQIEVVRVRTLRARLDQPLAESSLP